MSSLNTYESKQFDMPARELDLLLFIVSCDSRNIQIDEDSPRNIKHLWEDVRIKNQAIIIQDNMENTWRRFCQEININIIFNASNGKSYQLNVTKSLRFGVPDTSSPQGVASEIVAEQIDPSFLRNLEPLAYIDVLNSIADKLQHKRVESIRFDAKDPNNIYKGLPASIQRRIFEINLDHTSGIPINIDENWEEIVENH